MMSLKKYHNLSDSTNDAYNGADNDDVDDDNIMFI